MTARVLKFEVIGILMDRVRVRVEAECSLEMTSGIAEE